jgi:hypothetical protein
MTVIINDFEVVVPAPNPEPPAPQTQGLSQASNLYQPPRPEDIERILRRFAQRRLRLWAD